jgi:DNA-binding response OmpR family regulator
VPAAVRAVVSDGPGKTRILVADDDPQMRRLIRSILERDGFEVTEAADGLDALDALESRPVDLVVLDIDMPRLDGLGVLEELRARVQTSSVPVIVLTARTDDTEARVLDLGAQDFLSKPVQPQSLQARVKAVLRRTKIV